MSIGSATDVDADLRLFKILVVLKTTFYRAERRRSAGCGKPPRPWPAFNVVVTSPFLAKVYSAEVKRLLSMVALSIASTAAGRDTTNTIGAAKTEDKLDSSFFPANGSTKPATRPGAASCSIVVPPSNGDTISREEPTGS